MVRRLAAVLFAVIVVAGCDSDGATTVTRMLNDLRAQHGQQTLTRVTQLDAKAVAQAQVMARNRAISHSSEAALKFGVPRGWRRIGENVSEAGEIPRCFTVLEESPAHLANMLTPEFNQVGIGVVASGGRVFCVQVFVAR
jgi:uncharacterized protein YkwD